MIYKFYLPFLYTYKTRLKDIMKTISWIFIYIMPTYIYLNHFSTLNIINTTIIYIVQIFIVYNFYEVGYIQNDTETIKKEKNPTLRLNKLELSYYEKNKFRIYFYRSLIEVFLIVILVSMSYFYKLKFDYYIFVPVFLIIVYLIHNKLRNKFNLITVFLLFCIRYLSYPILFLDNVTFLDLVLGIFMYPFSALILWAAKKRFSLLPNLIRDNVLGFRVLYYFFVVIISGFLYLKLNISYFNILFIISIYFFVYRSLIFIFFKDKVEYKK